MGGGVHVDGDVFRRFVVSGRAEMAKDVSDEASECERAGFDVVVGPLLAELAPHYDRVVVLFPPEDAIVERHEPWVYRLFTVETERVGEWIDNRDLTPEQTAAAILRA